MRRWRMAAATAAMLAAFFGAASAEVIWHPDSGFVNLGQAPSDDDRGLYDYAVGLMTAGEFPPAAELLGRALTRFPDSPLAPRMRLRLAECAYREGDSRLAFRRCDELLESAPPGDAELANAARELRFTAALAAGRAEARAGIEMLLTIGRGGVDEPRAARALLEAGKLSLGLGDYSGAAEALGLCYQAAPDTESGRQALFWAARARLRQARESDRPEELLLAAAADLAACVKAAPDAADAAQAEKLRELAGRAASSNADERRAYLGAICFLDDDAARALRLLDSKRTRRLPRGAAAETATYYRALALAELGRYYAAFLVYEELLREYPAGGWRRAAMEAELELGRRLREAGDGGCARVFEAVSRREPLGSLAAEAEWERGEWLLAERDYDEAAAAYELICETHPRSARAPAARLRHGCCLERMALDFDDTSALLRRARTELTAYLEDYPRGEHADEARAVLGAVKERQAAGAWEIAAFYGRKDAPMARLSYLRMIVADYAETTWGESARAVLAHEFGEVGDAADGKR